MKTRLFTAGRHACRRRLLPAAPLRRPATPAAGPFSAPSPDPRSPAVGNALLTALMIVYPAFATVAVIAIGLLLAKPAGV